MSLSLYLGEKIYIILSVCSNHPYRLHVLVVKGSLPDHTWVHMDIFYSLTDKHPIVHADGYLLQPYMQMDIFYSPTCRWISLTAL